ncbi:GNAT family N-acetyltransferase [Autumnicola edwardsiae]|uniref:GNAT family N-acetyltransferase n=1 Tax=Autumnicola edwardsiae TaxID=3075594 RepID=A0ABU3CUQ9_9FLAO|nr:GNAT family N-acetyltransferase [Zunongwangia sp. F297]MDT0649645.1 GNAT family N-acetyltransferase [Zunongwangia sp. F297]
MKLQLRRLEDKDCLLLFEWINDPEVRRNAFNSKEINLEEHKEWFYNIRKSDYSKIYVLEQENEPIGQIRFDREKDYWKISYSIDRRYRGQGLGTRILELGISKIKGKFRAWVKNGNPKSKKVFEKLGFVQVDRSEESVEYEIIT